MLKEFFFTFGAYFITRFDRVCRHISPLSAVVQERDLYFKIMLYDRPAHRLTCVRRPGHPVECVFYPKASHPFFAVRDSVETLPLDGSDHPKAPLTVCWSALLIIQHLSVLDAEPLASSWENSSALLYVLPYVATADLCYSAPQTSYCYPVLTPFLLVH